MKGDNVRKLTDDEMEYIHQRGQRGVCMAALARKFHVSRQRVFQIVKRREVMPMI